MENKKGNKKTIIIIAAIIVVLGLACYICYDKGIIFNNQNDKESSNVKNETQKNNENETVTFTNSELEKYVNYILPVSIGPSELLYNKDYINSEDLTVSDKIKYIGSYVFSKTTTTEDYQYNVISESTLKNAVEEIYGPNTYEKTTFNIGCGDYILNESDGKYYSQTGCGGTGVKFVSNIVIDYKATKNSLEITTAYAFLDIMTNKIYKDYNQINILDEYNNPNANAEEINSYLKDYVKNNQDKLSNITYTFESNDGEHYYFKGFVNNKN